MEAEERRNLEERLYSQGLTPVAFSYQNAITAREPTERFNQWFYLYEVALKCLASLAWARSRSLGNQPPDLLFFVRDSFTQTSQGHWLQLLSACTDHLKRENDAWGRSLDGALRKKLRQASLFEIRHVVAGLHGHTEPNESKISVIEFMQLLIELRNKTQGHGAPRRSFYEDINLHLENSLLCLLAEWERFLIGGLLYADKLEPVQDGAAIEGLLLQGLRKSPWQGQAASIFGAQARILFALTGSEGNWSLYALDPLLVWDGRSDAVCIYNAYNESRQQFEYLSYARGEPLHIRGRPFLTAFGLPAITPPTFSRGTMKLWSDKGVALYPVDTALVGQNSVFNALLKFRRKFGQTRMSNFFALIGDWGLGKSRIGLELFAESFGHVDRWLGDPDDYVLPNSEGRVLSQGLADGILPLFIRYDMACTDDLYANNWIARLSTLALTLVAEGSGQGKVPDALLADLRTALKAKGVDLDALKAALTQAGDDDTRLRAALDTLRPAGVEHLWVVVDEVETVSDYQRRLPEESSRPVSAEYLTLVADVFRHENYRTAQPFYASVHFLMLCSEGMRDKLEIGPIRRRDDVLLLTPNRLSDAKRFVEHLKARALDAGQSVDYPQGTVEAAFLASNRNFGWFNVLMSSIHESYQRYLAEGKSVTGAELIGEFARSESRARYVFNREGIELLRGVTGSLRPHVEQLVLGQLPVLIGDQITEDQAKQLSQARLPGLEGSAFAELFQVHLDAATLADELTRPEVGFRLAQDVAGGYYDFFNTRLNVQALLSALQAFSVATGNDNFLVYADSGQFAAQLKALYPEPNIEQAADALHQVFGSFQVQGRRFIGASFPLLQRVDELLSRGAQRTTFFRDQAEEARLESYVRELSASESRRQQAVCEGFAKLLDDSLTEVHVARGIQSAASVSFTSKFQSPRLDGLRVTRDGRLVIVYCRDATRLAADLATLLGQEPVHPMVVLMPPHADPADFQRAIERMPLAQRCVIVRRLNTFEEDFLCKYSGRGTAFGNQLLSDWALSRSGAILQEWKRQVDSWYQALENSGYLLRPIWYTERGIARSDFYRAYRLMLANNWTIDQISPDMNQGFDAQTYAQVQNACRKNVEVPAGKPDTLPILSDEPYRPTPPAAFGALLYELTQQASLESLSKRFFFAVPDDPSTTKQLEHILELLREFGLVTLQASAYRAVNGDLLRQYREATAAWLDGACRQSLAEVKDLFPSQAQVLEAGDVRFASDDLARVETLISGMDLSPLSRGPQIDAQAISLLVKQILEIEVTLQKVCPPAVYRREGQPFRSTPDQIRAYETRYSSLSLWEKVSLLAWLRDTFAERRTQIGDEIRRQLSDVQSMQTVSGHPFPIAALTQPLKAIEQELMSGAGDTVSVSGRLNVPGYPYEIRRYLLTGKYEEAWHRLEALTRLLERTQPTSLWVKFKAAFDRWQNALRQFEQAQAAWRRLNTFMSDAPAGAWTGSERVRVDFTDIEAVVEGGLSQTILSQVNSLQAVQLLDELTNEVDGYSHKIENLPARIESAQNDIERELKALLNLERVRALNEVLRASRQSEVKLPELAETYKASKQRFEAFNTDVNDRGLALFDHANRHTSWTLWIEIYQDLVNDRYVPRPEHRPALDELEELGVVVRTVKLRR